MVKASDARHPTSDCPLILFGGTFDPIHRAHVQAALAVSRALGNAPVHLLPNAVPPHRPQPLANGEQRLAMVRRACIGHRQLIADDWELRQAPQPSYTLATLKHYKRLIGRRPLVFVIGADSLVSLNRWHRWQEFPALCHLAVVPRPHSPPAPFAVQHAFPEAPATLLRRRPAGRRLMLRHPSMSVSATDIRQALQRNSGNRHLPPAVLAHIRRLGLYNVDTVNTQDQSSTHNEAP